MSESEDAFTRPGCSGSEAEFRVRVADGRTVACLGVGDPQGSPVFYFHGLPGSRLEARVSADAAAALGVRLVGVDRPGFGESTFQPRRRIGQWTADITAVADALGLKRFSVLGMSAGAPYALACAAALAERLNRIALISPLSPLAVGDRPPGMIAHDRLLLALAAHAPTLARGVAHVIGSWMRRRPDRYVKFMTAGLSSPDRNLFADPDYRSMMTQNMMEALRQGARGAAWELTLIVQPWDFPLENVRTRVSLWQGLADQILPAAMARRLAQTLTACEARYFPHEGHLSTLVHHIGDVLAELRSATQPSI